MKILDQSFNSSPPGQNGCHFADNTFKYISLNENLRISITISLKFVPKDPIDSKSASVQVIACHLFGTKTLLETMLTQFIDTYMWH